MIEAIKEVLKGIDQTELESTDGWWETSAGAEFGAKKLKYILGLLAQPAQQEPWCMKMNGCKTKCEDCPVEVAQQEPVAKYSDIVSDGGLDPRNKFDAAPQRTWVGLDEKDFSAINQSCLTKLQAATSAESILKEKNT